MVKIVYVKYLEEYWAQIVLIKLAFIIFFA